MFARQFLLVGDGWVGAAEIYVYTYRHYGICAQIISFYLKFQFHSMDICYKEYAKIESCGDN